MAMTLLASFLYSAHLPECLAPGRFDYIGEWEVVLLDGRVILTPVHVAAEWEGMTRRRAAVEAEKEAILEGAVWVSDIAS
jgi:hypothetical protein